MSRDYRQGWVQLFRENLNKLFEVALLITADPMMAEASVTRSIEDLDFSMAPDIHTLQDGVVFHSIKIDGTSSETGATVARSMLRKELWPVLRVTRAVRACFTLKVLMGYGRLACARMLGIDEQLMTALLKIAILQVQSAMIASEHDGQVHSGSRSWS
jgi:hypothetical protein